MNQPQTRRRSHQQARRMTVPRQRPKPKSAKQSARNIEGQNTATVQGRQTRQTTCPARAKRKKLPSRHGDLQVEVEAAGAAVSRNNARQKQHRPRVQLSRIYKADSITSEAAKRSFSMGLAKRKRRNIATEPPEIQRHGSANAHVKNSTFHFACGTFAEIAVQK